MQNCLLGTVFLSSRKRTVITFTAHVCLPFPALPALLFSDLYLPFTWVFYIENLKFPYTSGFYPLYSINWKAPLTHLSLVNSLVQFSQLSHVRLFAIPWTAAHQASLSFTNFQSLLKLMSITSVMPSNHLILCCPLLLLLSNFPRIRVFSSESVVRITWTNYWSFSFSIRPSNEYSGLIPLGLTGLTSLLSKGFSRVFSNTTVQKHQFFTAQLSL